MEASYRAHLCLRPRRRELRRPYRRYRIQETAIHPHRPPCLPRHLPETKYRSHQGDRIMRAADDRSEAVPASGLQRYFRDARSWDQDRIRNALRSTRIAWSIAAIASLLAAASIFAVAALTPLKTVVPYVIRVNQTTGAVRSEEHTSALQSLMRKSYDV